MLICNSHRRRSFKTVASAVSFLREAMSPDQPQFALALEISNAASSSALCPSQPIGGSMTQSAGYQQHCEPEEEEEEEEDQNTEETDCKYYGG
ncbi:hypothetical protein F2P81_011656 [Scophthalmus maximus]|uniref:Uncharacterized protein n=1 Tax=Scophthalmus maximus TaxID=52904 RepID=A0A6A4SZ76_SCOMX|nr:hypothetical protein F2P81_011656 [Scophthalmus maximus]